MEIILTKIKKILPKKLYAFSQPAYHFSLTVIGNLIYRFPGRKIKCIGVTGTNGKTTTCALALELLKNAGYRVGACTTNFVEIDGKRTKNASGFTTMGGLKLQKTLKEMVNKRCDWAVIEVTSQGLNQFRLLGVSFDIVVFTNLTHEHLDIHGTMENYRNAKAKLFKSLKRSKNKGVKKTIIANTDDKYGEFYLNFWADKKYAFGFNNNGFENGLFANIKTSSDKGTVFEVYHNKEKENYSFSLVGKVNIYNALACIALADALGIKKEHVMKTLEMAPLVEGRLERVWSNEIFDIYVDYAITPDAAEKMYTSLRDIAIGKIISVFGCTGDRDVLKRPLMGKIASRLVDMIFITDDETYTEDPDKIIEDIVKGINKQEMKKVVIERDRKKAIEMAVKTAKKGDIVVVSGMGHETVRNMGEKNEPWSDKEIIKEITNLMYKLQ